MVFFMPAVIPLSTGQPPGSDALPRGFCKYWDGLLIKANGRIPCGSDHGESYTIVKTDLEAADFVPDVFNGPEFREMRMRTAVDRRAFHGHCRQCAAFRPLDPDFKADRRNPHYPELSALDARASREMLRVQSQRGWPLGSIDWIGSLHLEPALPCTLRCPACLQGFDRNLLRREGPPYYLPIKILGSILQSTKRHRVKVRRIGFGGRGEPTLNPQLPEIVRRCRDECPDAIIETDTNAQHPFHDDFLLLDAIYCSIDGSTQESYETYRIGGRFEKCLAFMQEAVERKRALQSKCYIVWKYILFDTTESIELLDLAQRTAAKLGVDVLWFVITWAAGTNGKVFPPRKMTTLESVQAYLQSHRIFPNARVKYQ
jgi:hypothetical protein